MNCMGSSTAAMTGCRCGSMSPGRITASAKSSRMRCSLPSSHGRSDSSVPTSRIMPSRTATAVASGQEGFMVMIRRATKTSIMDGSSLHA